MRNKRIAAALCAACLLLPFSAAEVTHNAGARLFAADNAGAPAQNMQAAENGASREALRRVMWVVLIVWAGIALYLVKIDCEVARAERRLREE